MRLLSATLLATAILLGAPADRAFAQNAALDDFTATCRANPGFFSFVLDPPDGPAVAALCDCLSGRFADYPAADLGMLARDVDGTATADDRTAYGDYTALELRARQALDSCLAATVRPPTGPGADMTRFDAACTGSPMLVEVLGGAPDQQEPRRTALCTCLSAEIGARVTTEDANVLATDLDGSATEASRAAHPGYPALSEMAGGIFDTCFAGLPQ